MKSTLNSSSSEDSKFSKLSTKEKGKAIGGMPDEWDKKNIETLIDIYRRAFPNRLKAMKDEVDMEARLREVTTDREKDYGVVSKDSDMRVAFWMPEDLMEVLEKGYPSLWTNKRHTQWFLDNFPEFRRSEKV